MIGTILLVILLGWTTKNIVGMLFAGPVNYMIDYGSNLALLIFWFVYGVKHLFWG